VVAAISLAGCKETQSMEALDSSKYFADRTVAAFVDDVQRGNVARVKAGLAAGIDPNAEGSQGFRPIHFVFFAKDAEVLKLLLAAKANPNAALANGSTPLHFSVRNQNPDFTKLLLGAGANPNGIGENKKPHVHEAINQVAAAAQAKLLASAGADLNVVWGGATPVMSAMEIGQWEVAQALIDLGADLKFKNHFGETALDLACQFVKGLPVNEANKKGIAGIVQSLSRRSVELPCREGLSRFR
jgi:hypothetical protein